MDTIAYNKGYIDASENKAVHWSSYPGSRLSYLKGYKQHLLDHAIAIQTDIDATQEELDELMRK